MGGGREWKKNRLREIERENKEAMFIILYYCKAYIHPPKPSPTCTIKKTAGCVYVCVNSIISLFLYIYYIHSDYVGTSICHKHALCRDYARHGHNNNGGAQRETAAVVLVVIWRRIFGRVVRFRAGSPSSLFSRSFCICAGWKSNEY